MFQTAPWDLPPSDYEQVWKVAGDQVQVTIFKYFRSFINYLPRQEPSSNCNKYTQNVCTTVGDFYLSIPTCSNWPYSGDWHPMQPSASWDLWASSQAALQLDSQGSLHQRKLLFVCLSCFWLFLTCSSGARDQMQEGALGEVYRGPSGEVSASTRAKVHSGWYHPFY